MKIGEFFSGRFRRNTSKLLGLRYRKTLLPYCLRRRLFVGVLSGVAPSATALGVKNAGCHTPPAVLVRGGSTKYQMGVVSRAAVGIAIVGRSVASLPSSLHTYFTTQSRKSQ